MPTAAPRLCSSARGVSERARNRQMVGVEDATVNPRNIPIPDRLRPLNEEKVVEIMESMRRVGQISPLLGSLDRRIRECGPGLRASST